LSAVDRSLPTSPFALLALFLSPCKDEAWVRLLREAASRNELSWGGLLFQANLHLCTPLWYVQLRRDELLDCLPGELQVYLHHLYQANRERNQALVEALHTVLGRFQNAGIKAVLLKGGASFCDDLYGDAGARVMQDVDLLVQADHTEAARSILLDLGYEQIPDPNLEFDDLPTDARHPHLPGFRSQDSVTAIEIHYKIAYGQAGRALPAATAWRQKVPTRLGRQQVEVLHPTHRLLHNAVHALVPHAEMIRGAVSLQQLSEFAFLAARYRKEIDRDSCLEAGRQAGLATALHTYRVLAHRLLQVPLPPRTGGRPWVRLHALRHLATSNYLYEVPEVNYSFTKRLFRTIIILAVKAYYYACLPGWTWRNVCYAEGTGNIPVRLACMVKKLANRRSRGRAGY
jgi:hypothetical protein